MKEQIKRKLWDWLWILPHNVRAFLCVKFGRHLGKSWLGIRTIDEKGEGFCSICGTGALGKPHYQ